MEPGEIDRAVVTLIRNKKSPNDYNIRFDLDVDRALFWVKRLGDQFDYEVELGCQFLFEEEVQEDGFWHPAQNEGKQFVEYLKEVVAKERIDEKFLNGWYRIEDISNSERIKQSFKSYLQEKKTEEEKPKTGMQTSLF
ncbi:MAG: hypothetical protein Q8L88_03590 [Bacteroidota bacterium]|nr:hypothetical protein [Bacteroidota bacterium]